MYAVRDRIVVRVLCLSETEKEREIVRKGGLVLLSVLLIYEPGKEIFHLLPFISFIHPLPPPFYCLNRIQPGLYVPHTCHKIVTMEQKKKRERKRWRKRERETECDREKYRE